MSVILGHNIFKFCYWTFFYFFFSFSATIRDGGYEQVEELVTTFFLELLFDSKFKFEFCMEFLRFYAPLHLQLLDKPAYAHTIMSRVIRDTIPINCSYTSRNRGIDNKI
jgi:hypothetical protein